MEIDHFALIPPEGVVVNCTCGAQITEILVPSDSRIATVQPCGCYLTPDEVEQVIVSQSSA